MTQALTDLSWLATVTFCYIVTFRWANLVSTWKECLFWQVLLFEVVTVEALLRSSLPRDGQTPASYP